MGRIVKRLAVPEGWDRLGRHLIEEHELEPDQIDALDSRTLRYVHRYRHAQGHWTQNTTERNHDHR